jgi:predicted phosphodiesterase
MKNNRLMFLGDIHGNFSIILQYIKTYNIKNANIIQVGDFGVGFSNFVEENYVLSLINNHLIENNVFVWAIRGNHDYKPYFDNDPFGLSNIKLVPDYTVLNIEDNNILCIGGAVSVDRMYRMTGKQLSNKNAETTMGKSSWWPNEVFNLDTEKLGHFRNINIVVTHTCPSYCPPDNTFGFGPFVEGIIKDTNDSDLKTDLMYERNQVTDAFSILNLNNDIDYHYYGHFHKSDTFRNGNIHHRMLGVGELYEKKGD